MFWSSLPSSVKSAVISFFGCVIAIGSLLLLKYLFPDTDFTVLQVSILTAVGTWLAARVNDFTKPE